MRIFFALFSLLVLTTCSSNSVDNENCRFLLDIGVNESINLNFPQYIKLQSPSNPVYLQNVGNGGIIITNVGSGFAAFDAADPNHIFDTCSILTINGVIGECSCDDKNRFSLFNGLPLEDTNSETPTPRCALRRYRVEQTGNTLLIFN